MESVIQDLEENEGEVDLARLEWSEPQLAEKVRPEPVGATALEAEWP